MRPAFYKTESTSSELELKGNSSISRQETLFEVKKNTLPSLTKTSGSFSKSSHNRTITSRDEMNLAEFPLAVLSTRVDTRIKTLEFTDYTKGPNNEMVERRWIITGADKFGLPTSTDDDVVLGLIRLSMEQGFREPKVHFTRYELLKALRWSTEGRSYHRLIKSLDRLSGVRVRSSNSFYDNSTKSYQTSNFGIIDAYEINDERASLSNETSSFFIWSEMLFNSFKSGYIKKLDLDLYFSLKSAVARRLYRYLDKHFYFKGVIDAHLLTLAFEKIGLSRSYKYVSSIKQQILPALEELVAMGFLLKYDFLGSGEATVLRCYSNTENVSSKFIGNEKSENQQPQVMTGPLLKVKIEEKVNSNNQVEPNLKQNYLISILKERGLSGKQAQKLVFSHEEVAYGKMELIIEYFDFLVKSDDPKISKNPIGFLYRAMEFPFKIKLPREFQGNLERSKRLMRPEHKVVKTKKINDRHAVSKSVEKANEQALDPKERDRYNSYIQNELNCIMTRIAPAELGQLFAETENKMKTLKRILGEERFLEAVDGCVKDELRRRFRLPQFNEWLQLGADNSKSI